jgi:hypothetical protein
MRACFLGQNVCALGHGVAIVQSYPVGDSGTLHELSEAEAESRRNRIPEEFPLENLMMRDLKRQPGHIV